MLTIFEMKIAQISNDYKVHGDVDYEDIEWLIEQAKKVEVLEKRIKELAQSDYCIICGDNATEVRQGQFYCEDCSK